MMGNFIYSYKKNNSQYKNYSSRKIDKFIKKILIVSFIIFLIGVLWFLLISPCIIPASIDINGFNLLSRADILKAAGISSGTSFIFIDARKVRNSLSNHYLIESATVDKVFPNKVSINIKPRQAVAVVHAKINGKLKPLYFDHKGVIFQIGEKAGVNPPSWLPVITGIFNETDKLGLGTRFFSAYQPLFARLRMINDEDHSIWNAISEIEVVSKNESVFDIRLYPVYNLPKILMSSDINRDNIIYALVMAEKSMELDRVPDYIDVRSGSGVLYFK